MVVTDRLHGYLGTTNLNCPAGTHGINALANTCDPMDDNSHGTHVAGTIGAVGNNGEGVTGVNWNVQLMACKFLDSSGHGYLSGALALPRFCQDDEGRGRQHHRHQQQLGRRLTFSQALLDAIQAQQQRGILFIVAAGTTRQPRTMTPRRIIPPVITCQD